VVLKIGRYDYMFTYANTYLYMPAVIYMASGRNVVLGLTAVNGPAVD
jgi:hypothetical protein